MDSTEIGICNYSNENYFSSSLTLTRLNLVFPVELLILCYLFEEATLTILCICERPANPGIEGSCGRHDELVKHLRSTARDSDLAPGFPFWDVHVGFKPLVITVHLQILLERTLLISLSEHYLCVQWIRLHYFQCSEFVAVFLLSSIFLLGFIYL